MTADELERLPETGKRTELVRGHLILGEPPGFQHGDVVVTLAAIMKEYVTGQESGTRPGRNRIRAGNGEGVLPGFTCVLSEVL